MGNNPTLSAQAISQQLTADTTPLSVVVLDTVDSTNHYLCHHLEDVCVAAQQTNGKGRRGNTWVAEGHPITFSLRWEFANTPKTLSNLAMLTGVVCAKALHGLGYPDVQLKWPNDLMAQDKKLGGILVEHFQNDNASTVIIGIGINAMSNPNIAQPWCSLHQLSESIIDRNSIIAAILNQLVPALTNYAGQTLLQEHWNELDYSKDQTVTVYAQNNKITGIARGIALDGGLQLETPGGIQTFYSGEVSMRKSS